jgi:hypothetical protein
VPREIPDLPDIPIEFNPNPVENWKTWWDLLTKKERKPVYEPYPKEDMVQPWYPSPDRLLPPNFQPPTRGPSKWMWRAVAAGWVGYVLEKSGILDIVREALRPPKE